MGGKEGRLAVGTRALTIARHEFTWNTCNGDLPLSKSSWSWSWSWSDQRRRACSERTGNRSAQLEINLPPVRSMRSCARARALAHVTARAGARTQLHSACTRILFRARAVRATVTLTTFPHPRPPDPAPPRVPRRCDAVGSEWWRGGERREERHVPSVTSRGVHCNAVQCRRRSSLLRRDLGPCGGVRRVGDVGPRRRTLFDTENGGGGKVLSRD